ncbi:MAG: hypothetical protein ACYSWU_04230, partial [Planctomycetota bacterium]
MHEALGLVRHELGPDAAVLHTREVRSGLLFGWLAGRRQIEVTASTEVNVPSRLPTRRCDENAAVARQGSTCRASTSAPTMPDAAGRRPEDRPEDQPELPQEVQGQLTSLQSMVKELCRRSQGSHGHDLPDELFRLFADLLDADLSEDLARELVERIRLEAPGAEWADPVLAKARIARMIEGEINVA